MKNSRANEAEMTHPEPKRQWLMVFLGRRDWSSKLSLDINNLSKQWKTVQENGSVNVNIVCSALCTA